MAKGARSKMKKRLRSARGQHFYEIKGKQQLEVLSQKLHDPMYCMKADKALPPNAYLEPNNPLAVFPQTPKPQILDFRTHKMQYGGRTAVNTFRKINSKNAKVSKYTAIVKTTAMAEAEEKAKRDAEENVMEEDNQHKEEEPVVATSSKVTTVDDLTAMTEAMTIGKKKAKKGDADSSMPKINVKSKGIKNRKKACARSQKQVRF